MMAAKQTQTQPLKPQLLHVEGSFDELAQELADYMHIGEEMKTLLEEDEEPNQEEVLAKLVGASLALNASPEKEFTAASNLMIHLVLQSADPKKHLPALCANFAKPITSSPIHGPGLSLHALTTVFNLLRPENPIRSRVLIEILRFFRNHAMFDSLRPYLDRLPAWFETWDTSEELQRKIYEEVAEVAAEAGHDEESYQYILKALRTFDSDETSSKDAERLSIRAVRMALLSSTHFLFQDLRSVPSILALTDSHPVYSQLLDIFAEQDLEDYNDFNEEHDGFIEQERLDADKLYRKMRLLTFASLAAATPSREIEYRSIARALQVPSDDVERWAIDVIRAGLVEGKLSQRRQTFLVHKVTYRVFGQRQYHELDTRVNQWKAALQNVLQVLHQEANAARAAHELGAHSVDNILAAHSFGPAGAAKRTGQHHQASPQQGQQQGQQHQRERTDADD